MKNDSRSKPQAHQARRLVLGPTLGLILCAGLFGTTGMTGIHAQASGGSIFGSAPAGRTVKVQSSGGMSRRVKVNSSGHYRLGALPLGTYEATLVENDKEVDIHSDIQLRPGGSARVDFVCPDGPCADSSSNNNH